MISLVTLPGPGARPRLSPSLSIPGWKVSAQSLSACGSFVAYVEHTNTGSRKYFRGITPSPLVSEMVRLSTAAMWLLRFLFERSFAGRDLYSWQGTPMPCPLCVCV